MMKWNYKRLKSLQNNTKCSNKVVAHSYSLKWQNVVSQRDFITVKLRSVNGFNINW